jgi:hypothetical protein
MGDGSFCIPTQTAWDGRYFLFYMAFTTHDGTFVLRLMTAFAVGVEGFDQ